MKERSCPDCASEMEERFFFYFDNMKSLALNWHRGAPKALKAFGIIPEGIKIESSETLEVRSFRCATCELLKLYAMQPDR